MLSYSHQWQPSTALYVCPQVRCENCVRGYTTMQDNSTRDQPLETSTLFDEDKESHLSLWDLRLHKEGLVTGDWRACLDSMAGVDTEL